MVPRGTETVRPVANRFHRFEEIPGRAGQTIQRCWQIVPAHAAAPPKGAVEVAELDREPQVKLGWKVVQMERRGGQLRQVQADNVQRKAAVVDIGQPRAQLARRQEEEAARRREAEQKTLLEEVEAVFRGQGPINREATLQR